MGMVRVTHAVEIEPSESRSSAQVIVIWYVRVREPENSSGVKLRSVCKLSEQRVFKERHNTVIRKNSTGLKLEEDKLD